jgi:hypothetical protein
VCFRYVGVVESRRHCAVVSQRRAQCDVRAQGGGVIWRRGAVDGRPSKVNVGIRIGDGFDEDGGSNFCGVCNGVH